MTSPSEEDLEGLIERLERYVDSIEGRSDLKCGFRMVADVMIEAASALRRLQGERDEAVSTLRTIREQQKEDFARAQSAEARVEKLHEALDLAKERIDIWR